MPNISKFYPITSRKLSKTPSKILKLPWKTRNLDVFDIFIDKIEQKTTMKVSYESFGWNLLVISVISSTGQNMVPLISNEISLFDSKLKRRGICVVTLS